MLLNILLLATVEQPALDVTAHRPPATTWKKTPCGSPSGAQPAQPAGPYKVGVDHPGADIPPCGSKGCVLAASASASACEAKCNTTVGCFAYVFAPASCSGESGPICWTKSAASGAGRKDACRNSRELAKPATKQADIPSRWAAQVTADTTPLVAYPRPQMVRGSGDVSVLRDEGDASVWSNLNGLWEWEATTTTTPPVGKTLSGSILVPFPVESCLSGVAPVRRWPRQSCGEPAAAAEPTSLQNHRRLLLRSRPTPASPCLAGSELPSPRRSQTPRRLSSRCGTASCSTLRGMTRRARRCSTLGQSIGRYPPM